jgi:hypothetical protein
MSARGSGAKDAYGLDLSGPAPQLCCTSGTLHELYRDVAASGSLKVQLGNEHLELLLAVDRADDGIE